MEQIIAIKSNFYYQQQMGSEAFTLKPLLEITIVHSDGKVYQQNQENKLTAIAKTTETKFGFTMETLDTLITQLMVQKQALQKIADNAQTLNTIIANSGNTIQ